MANNAPYFRKASGSATFNTGTSKDRFDPGKIKGLILVQKGYKLPADLTAASLEAACHADRPDRIYPIKTIVEFAANGGDANVQTKGYGGSKFTGYNAYSATWTLDSADFVLKANLVKAKSTDFSLYLYDDENVIYGINDGTELLAGIPQTGVYTTGNDFDTSGEDASTMVNTMFKDYEKYLRMAEVRKCDFDIAETVNGLVYVEFQKQSAANEYKLIEHFGRADVTMYYADLLKTNKATIFEGTAPTEVTYANGVLTITITGNGTPSLKAPSVLQPLGIIGIEQWK